MVSINSKNKIAKKNNQIFDLHEDLENLSKVQIEFSKDDEIFNEESMLFEKLFQVFKYMDDFQKVIKPNSEYIVKFPEGLLKKMEDHDLQFLKDKVTGDLLPTLYDYTDKSIGGQIRLELRDKVSNQHWNNFSNSMSNIIQQAQYEKLASQIEDVQRTVKNIEKGQDNDRFAKINAGKLSLKNAMNANNKKNRDKFLDDARQELNLGIQEVKKTLISKLENLPDISEKFISRAVYILKKPDNRQKISNSYQEIQEYFFYYFEGIRLLAKVYTLMDEAQTIENILENTSDLFENINLKRLINIEPLLSVNMDFTNTWYRVPKMIEKQLIESYNNDSANYELKISGEELLTLERKIIDEE